MIMISLSSFLMFLTFLLMLNNKTIILNFPILSLSSSEFKMSLILDWMTTLFGSSVCFISGMILLYSKEYVSKLELKRFSTLLIMFVMSMLLLIFSNNMFFILLGWDGLGISSYILVIFYQNFKSSESGIITIISNRMGDISILLTISSLMFLGSWEFFMNSKFTSMIMILIILACISKSAQIPFSAWLPAAMAAPTPISALVHSSTLVTAGVFLILRTFNNQNQSMNSMLMFISVSTMLISGLSANWELDFKKIIAFSTLSQIAMMMYSISINALKASFFHLITHAFFKSTMFLCAGILIHQNNYQDLRFNSINSTPNLNILTIMGISSLALMGIPFLSGFLSKDLIIESLFTSNFNFILTSLMMMALTMSACYSIRLSALISKFTSKKKSDFILHKNILMPLSINILCSTSIISGTVLSWTFFTPNFIIINSSIKLTILSMVMSGILLSISSFWKKKKLFNFSKTLISIWFLHFISSENLVNLSNVGFLSSFLDNSWSENSSPLNNFLKISLLSKISLSLLPLSLIIIITILFWSII